MNKQRLAEARRLADRPYRVEIERDTLDGEEVFIARNPELPGCKSWGETVDEATANLTDARADFIFFLLEDDLPVPEPAISRV